ncbi:hypothetical protein Bravens_01833 [Brevibacterium ravenspurgense]|uniref:Uncharacterized protein n=1 Tax=Brevibacterium ravenspurgense TaxID=479117 RepID=A0A150H5H3_9MICO|nr:DUF6270 domain-containing protein [Brevibacterium ravenspurgense]KXZ57313.1 hypothetical protein Bravens_01833 [Brevibacterium ravenspurgense]
MEDTEQLQVAVFGSCVSRDTCEYLPSADVAPYVARQSAIVHLNPAGARRWSDEALNSAFQAKMFNGDMEADAVERLLEAEPDVLLIDLVDERRGVWVFPDGTYLTNSVEAFRTGVDDWAPREGGRLIPFGSDEHFRLWSAGFASVMRRLQAESSALTFFIDLDWAELIDDVNPSHGLVAFGGRAVRRLRRGLRTALRDVREGDYRAMLRDLCVPPATEREKLRREARRANRQFRRYRQFAQSRIDGVHIRRQADDLRMSTANQWGTAPYHYRAADYQSIADEIVNSIERKKGGFL